MIILKLLYFETLPRVYGINNISTINIGFYWSIKINRQSYSQLFIQIVMHYCVKNVYIFTYLFIYFLVKIIFLLTKKEPCAFTLLGHNFNK